MTRETVSRRRRPHTLDAVRYALPMPPYVSSHRAPCRVGAAAPRPAGSRRDRSRRPTGAQPHGGPWRARGRAFARRATLPYPSHRHTEGPGWPARRLLARAPLETGPPCSPGDPGPVRGLAAVLARSGSPWPRVAFPSVPGRAGVSAGPTLPLTRSLRLPLRPCVDLIGGDWRRFGGRVHHTRACADGILPSSRPRGYRADDRMSTWCVN